MYLRRIVLRKGYTTFLRFRYFIDFRCGIAIFADIFCGITVFVDIFCGIAVFGTPQCPPLATAVVSLLSTDIMSTDIIYQKLCLG